MKVISISCNHCGAPLDVPLKTRYLTCSFCESRLEVQQSGNAYFTSVLEAVSQIEEDVGTIKLQNELERIDREWQSRSPAHNNAGTTKMTRRHIPLLNQWILRTALGLIFAAGSGCDRGGLLKTHLLFLFADDRVFFSALSCPPMS